MRSLRIIRAATLLLVGATACGTQRFGLGTGGTGTGGTGTGGSGGATHKVTIFPTADQLDLLFVIDNSGDLDAQQKLAAQIPVMMQVLEQLPGGLPDLHVAVVSGDLGAVTSSPALSSCTTGGDGGHFLNPSSCQAGSLEAGATFLTAGPGGQNFTGALEGVVQCMVSVGTGGCPIQQPLAAVARALGADGAPAPAGNAGFLRSGAALGIIMLSSRDDCSTSGTSNLFAYDPSTAGLSDPLGPATSYRCNTHGNACAPDIGAMSLPPPLTPPSGVTGSPPILQMTTCAADAVSGGPLRPVTDLALAIRNLKPHPDQQIVVSAIVAPTAPYAVEWLPAGSLNAQNPAELWPSVMRSCGATDDATVNPDATDRSGDGTFGEPAVRIAAFAGMFGHELEISICRPAYSDAIAQIAGGLGGVTGGVTCTEPTVPTDAVYAQPLCTMVANLADGTRLAIPNCDIPSDAAAGSCWRAAALDASVCPNDGRPIVINPSPVGTSSEILSYDLTCPCGRGSSDAGCL